jgi:hypothetical protein
VNRRRNVQSSRKSALLVGQSECLQSAGLRYFRYSCAIRKSPRITRLALRSVWFQSRLLSCPARCQPSTSSGI